MTYSAIIRIAPVLTATILRDSETVPPGSTLYGSGALQLQRAEVPVLLNHQDDQEVGVVRKLFEFPDADGLWVWADTVITKPPSWLSTRTKASMGHASLHQQQVGEWSRVHRALVTEVSLLEPGVAPAEPMARVMLLRRTSSSAAEGSTSDLTAAGEIHLPPGARLRRPGRIIGIR